MSWRRAKTSGGAAFDPKKQQKEVTNHETHKNPHPPISNIRTRRHHQNPSRNADLTATGSSLTSFSSVLTHSGKVLHDDNVTLGLLMDSLSMIPVEPEWEDDDFYLMHRKEAIRAMRLASQYSKAATEAYQRRDHAAAKEFSIKAREEWSTSEKLNAKAAKEILAIRNSKNDEWKLDLHGLHAAEAVQVLQEHLLKIECQVSANHSTKPYKTNLKVHSTHAASIESVGSVTKKLDRQQSSGPRLLEVITGKGSHSQGQAVLPVAIRSFLSKKRYNYYEASTGVITVLPKFRQLSTALLKT